MGELIDTFVADSLVHNRVVSYLEDTKIVCVKTKKGNCMVYPCIRGKGVVIRCGHGRGSRRRLEMPSLEQLWSAVYYE